MSKVNEVKRGDIFTVPAKDLEKVFAVLAYPDKSVNGSMGETVHPMLA